MDSLEEKNYIFHYTRKNAKLIFRILAAVVLCTENNSPRKLKLMLWYSLTKTIKTTSSSLKAKPLGTQTVRKAVNSEIMFCISCRHPSPVKVRILLSFSTSGYESNGLERPISEWGFTWMQASRNVPACWHTMEANIWRTSSGGAVRNVQVYN